MTDDLLTPQMIADLLGVGGTAVVNWRKRPATQFPPPDLELGPRHRLWKRSTVIAWAREHRPELLPSTEL